MNGMKRSEREEVGRKEEASMKEPFDLRSILLLKMAQTGEWW